VIVTGVSPGYKWIMTCRPLPENSSEFFVEWQIAEGSDTFIDLSADADEAEARMADKSEVKATSEN
jgi:hypothetical protein